MLAVAIEEARHGLVEGGIPIGAALFTRTGELVSRGHNRRVQQGDPSVHAETDAFRRAGRQRSYRNLVMVTTLAPCWYCSGLVRQFRIGTLVVGESRTFAGGLDWLRENGVEVIDLDNAECREMLCGLHPKTPGDLERRYRGRGMTGTGIVFSGRLYAGAGRQDTHPHGSHRHARERYSAGRTARHKIIA